MPEVKAARDVAGPDVPIMVDTNCPWTVAQAIEMARRLAHLDLHWLEEPVWPPENLAGLAEVRARGGIPTAAGENYGTVWEFRRACEAGAITYAQPSVTKIGGVTEMRRVMTVCEAFGVQVVPHSAYFGPGLIASIHCIAAMPTESLVERFYCDFAENPLGDAIHPKGGRIAVPQGPGLGAGSRSATARETADRLTPEALQASQLPEPAIQGRHSVVHLLGEAGGGGASLRGLGPDSHRRLGGVAVGAAALHSVLALFHADRSPRCQHTRPWPRPSAAALRPRSRRPAPAPGLPHAA